MALRMVVRLRMVDGLRIVPKWPDRLKKVVGLHMAVGGIVCVCVCVLRREVEYLLYEVLFSGLCYRHAQIACRI
jgi:hypothetical protein